MLGAECCIEAARAGEHGKGFAVVAAEVAQAGETQPGAAAEIGQVASSSVASRNVRQAAGRDRSRINRDLRPGAGNHCGERGTILRRGPDQHRHEPDEPDHAAERLGVGTAGATAKR